MKKLENLRGINLLTKTQKKAIHGGQSWDCKYENPDGTLHTVVESSAANAIANCDAHTNCKGCSPSKSIGSGPAPKGGKK